MRQTQNPGRPARFAAGRRARGSDWQFRRKSPMMRPAAPQHPGQHL